MLTKWKPFILKGFSATEQWNYNCATLDGDKESQAGKDHSGCVLYLSYCFGKIFEVLIYFALLLVFLRAKCALYLHIYCTLYLKMSDCYCFK